MEWLLGDDTGVSSEAIWRHMMGRRQRDGYFNYPSDPDDFGRCHRLLCLIPEWRARMPEMAKHGKVWAGLVARWEEVTQSYRAEVRSSGGQDPDGERWTRGSAPATYNLMKSIQYPIEGRGQWKTV